MTVTALPSCEPAKPRNLEVSSRRRFGHDALERSRRACGASSSGGSL